MLPARTGRLSAETIPEVTVLARPSGEPIAITGSPTLTFAESPTLITGRFPVLTLSTAMSYAISRPTIVAVKISPFNNSTSMVPLVTASSITWLLVMIKLSEELVL